MVDGGVLAEVDARGSSVGYSSVVDRKMGWVRDGWAAGQGDSKSKFVERLKEIRGLSRLRFCWYVWPRASGGPVGCLVLVGNRATHDVVCGGGLVAFLGVRAGVAGVAMSNAGAMRPAVACRVRFSLLVRVIAAAPPHTATPGHGRKLVTQGFDLVGQGGVGGGKRGVRGDKLLEDSFLVGGSAGEVVEGIVDGVEEARVEGGGVG